jgi:SAM-dependent methyltransferase
MVIKQLKEIFYQEQFQPGLLGCLINPFYFARKGLYENIKALAPSIQGKTLDIGCGQKPYRSLYQSSEYIGLEIESPENLMTKQADYFYDGKTFPFGDREFDSIVTNQVFEHVFNPLEFLSEIHRVLKEEGIFLISVPFVWDEHEQPYDYARYSSFGLRHLLEMQGFQILEHRKSLTDVRVIFQLWTGFIYKTTPIENPYLDLLRTLFLIAPFNFLGELLAIVLPKNEDLYLDNIILAKKII